MGLDLCLEAKEGGTKSVCYTLLKCHAGEECPKQGPHWKWQKGLEGSSVGVEIEK